MESASDPRIGLTRRDAGRFGELRDQWNLSGYTLEWRGEYENSANAQAALAGKLPVTGLLMVLVLIFLFNDLRQPVIIVLSVPLY